MADFSFSDASSTKVPYTDGEPFDPLTEYEFVSSNGFGLLLSGTRENLRLALLDDPVIITANAEITPLLIPAPRGEAAPALGGAGSGAVFGENLRWAFRYKNSRTAEVSGLSEYPEEGWNVGAEVIPGSADYVGEEAIFLLPGTGFPGVDTIELFRTTSNGNVFFKVGTYSNPGSGSSVSAIDNLGDEDIITEETAGLRPNPSYNESGPWSCAKAYKHSTGRLCLYGIRRHGVVRLASGAATGPTTTDGDTSFSLSAFTTQAASLGLDPVYKGFRLQRGANLANAYSATIIADDLVYRIVDVDGTDVYVYPPFESTNSDTDFFIIDDRDARTVWVSQPGQPLNYDATEVWTIGHNQDDPLLHLDAIGGTTVALTRQRLYAITDDGTEAPHLSYRQAVLAEEGTFGLRSSVNTPFGLVFVNERGVRVFDGSMVKPLGSSSPFNDFLLKTQFASFSQGALDEVRVFYAPETNLLHVFYIPSGKTGFQEEIVFDPESGVWRGPWRRRGYSAGYLRNTDGSRSWLFGDDYGNIWQDEQQDVDVLDRSTESSAALTFYLASGDVQSTRKFTPTNLSATDPDNFVGVPILISSDGSTWEQTWVAHSDGTDLELEDVPSTALATGIQMKVGAIEWTAETAYLDGGEPIQPKELQTFRLRYRKPTARSGEDYEDERLKIEVSVEEGSYVETASTTKREDIPATSTYYRVRADKRGRSFQAKFSGVSQQNEPQITAVVADIDVRAGE